VLEATSSPAECLSGLVLDGGWTVGRRITPTGGTGGNFSVRYVATSPDGREAFLKALNIKSLFENPANDVISAMKYLGTLFDHEREMLRKCEGMTRVVTALAEGQVVVPNMPLGLVPYFIFEMASGDVRSHLEELGEGADDAFKLRSLHQIAVGLFQMHAQFIAHQDVKPSNILMYANGSRIGDLGRVSERGVVCPFDDKPMAGDPMYAPPEVFYGYFSSEWTVRRFGPDLYLLGNMVVFLFAQVSMNALLYKNLDQRFYTPHWNGGYDAVLPYLQDAFAKALDEFESAIPEPSLRRQLRSIVAELCNPDVNRRGHPRSKRSVRSPFALEQYVSRFNHLARRAELQLRS